MPRLCRSALAPVPPVGTQTQQTESHQGQGRTDRDRVTGIGINLLQGADREVIKREYITFTRTGQKGDGSEQFRRILRNDTVKQYRTIG